MAVSEQCQAAMIEHGVFTITREDGTVVPAGYELMNSDVIRVALVEGVDGQLPENKVMNEIRDYFIDNNYEDMLSSVSSFSIPMEDITVRAFARWTDADIEFVKYTDNPDVTIFPFQFSDRLNSVAGAASVPLHDTPEGERRGLNHSAIGLDMQYFSREQLISLTEVLIGGSLSEVEKEAFPDVPPIEVTLFETLEHEIGHTFGIDHPFDAAENVYHETLTRVCTKSELNALGESEIFGIMAYGDSEQHTETWYDEGTREAVQIGTPALSKNP